MDYGSRVPGPYGHAFCGTTRLVGAACPVCDRPLVQLLSLDARDPLLAALGRELPRIPLLFCWGCRSERAASFYRIEADRVVPRRRNRRAQPLRWPYEEYPAAFPEAPARLVPLPREVQAHLKTLNRQGSAVDLADDARLPRHQVGGEPLLLAPWRVVSCPRCRRRMPFLAAIADENLDPRGFSGQATAQVLFHICPGCQTIGAYAQNGRELGPRIDGPASAPTDTRA